MRLDFDHAGASTVRLSIAAAMVIAKPVCGKLFIFFGDCDLCKERSTKRKRGWKYPHGGDETVASGSPFLARAGLELAYLSGYSRLMQRRTGGAGVILRFERVRPRRTARFQPLESREITPRFLDRAIGALKRWKFDIVSMDEVCRRAVTLASPRRFVCLTFDGGYKDMITSAYPVLSRQGFP